MGLAKEVHVVQIILNVANNDDFLNFTGQEDLKPVIGYTTAACLSVKDATSFKLGLGC